MKLCSWVRTVYRVKEERRYPFPSVAGSRGRNSSFRMAFPNKDLGVASEGGRPWCVGKGRFKAAEAEKGEGGEKLANKPTPRIDSV